MNNKKKTQTSAPILELPEPCEMPWAEMQRTDQGRRFCDSCSKHVHDLSSMTRSEALELLAKEDWNICVNYQVTPEGDMVFKAEPPTKLQRQVEGIKKLLAAASLTPITLAAGACDSNPLRMGGEPVAVVDHRAESDSPSQLIDTTQTRAKLKQGGVLEVDPPATEHNEPNSEDGVSCDGLGESDETDEQKDKTNQDQNLPVQPPQPLRLGGAPRSIDHPSHHAPAPKP